MPDDYTEMDEAPSLSEAPDTQDVDDTDTDDTAAAESAGRSSEGEADEERTRLTKEVEDLRKRVAGASRTYQDKERLEREHQQAKQELDLFKQTIAFWESHGVKATEIDRMIREKAGLPAQNYGQQPMQQPAQQSPERAAQALGNLMDAKRWEDYRDEYIEDHPEYDTPRWRRMFDFIAKEHLDEERATNNGQIQTRPRKLVKHVIGEVDKMRAVETKKAEEKARQTRTKLNQQGVVEGATQTRRKTSEDDEGTPMGDEEYLTMLSKHKQGFKRRR